MTSSPERSDPVIRRIRQWAEQHPQIHAVILTSSRAVRCRPLDALSDYDVIVYCSDPTPFLEDGSWACALGPVLLQMPAEGMTEQWTTATRLVLYRDGTKIDFSLLPVEALESAAERGVLSRELDAGFEVVFDQAGLTAALPSPSGIAYRVTAPTQAEFSAVVEEFLWEATYVAKSLFRSELLPAKHSFNCVMKVDLLRRMFEWRVACDRGWSYRAGVLGRNLKAQIPADRWAAFERTFVGADIERNWEALFETEFLFREIAIEVAEHLDLAYPEDLAHDVLEYLKNIWSLE